MKFVVIGANGQLGRAFQDCLPAATFLDHGRLDLEWLDKDIYQAIAALKPDIVINCAAYTQVDKAQTEISRAQRINGSAVAVMARACYELRARFITYSTDYVFNGQPVKGGYREDWSLDPQSEYGSSKKLGEDAIINLPNVTVVRTSWVFGQGKNFVQTMLRLAASGMNPISVVNDQIGRPTYAPDLAAATLQILRADQAPNIIHVSNEGDPVSWAGYAKTIFDTAGLDIKVQPVSSEQYYQSKTGYAPRPHYSVFNLDRLHNLGIMLRPWSKALAEYLKS